MSLDPRFTNFTDPSSFVKAAGTNLLVRGHLNPVPFRPCSRQQASPSPLRRRTFPFQRFAPPATQRNSNQSHCDPGRVGTTTGDTTGEWEARRPPPMKKPAWVQGPSRRMFEEPSPETFGVATPPPPIVPKCASRLQSSSAMRTGQRHQRQKIPFLLLTRF